MAEITPTNVNLDTASFDDSTIVAPVVTQTADGLTVTTGTANRGTGSVVDYDANGSLVQADVTRVVEQSANDAARQTTVDSISTLITTICDDPSMGDIGSLEDYRALLTTVQNMQSTTTLALAGTSATSMDSVETTVIALTTLLQSMTVKMQQATTVDDTALLARIKRYVTSIADMRDAMANFKFQIAVTSKISIPKSVSDVTQRLEESKVCIDEVVSTMKKFTGVESGAKMSAECRAQLDRAQIAVDMLDNLGNTDTNMSTNPDVVKLQSAITAITGMGSGLESCKTALDAFRSSLSGARSGDRSGDRSGASSPS